MAFVKFWVHAVWSTKHRQPVLTKEVRSQLFPHIREYGSTKDLYLDFVNGYTDHVHCLFTLRADMSIAKAMQLIKGESAYWANNQGLVQPKLEWGEEYFAASVSESNIDKVRDYIRDQELHHSKVTFQQEYDRFLKHSILKRRLFINSFPDLPRKMTGQVSQG